MQDNLCNQLLKMPANAVAELTKQGVADDALLQLLDKSVPVDVIVNVASRAGGNDVVINLPRMG